MADPAFTVPDPRIFPSIESAPPELRTLYELAEESLAADSQQRADACDSELRAALARELESDGRRLAAAFSHAPSVAVTRHLWRVLDSVWSAPPRDAALAVTVFALPLVVVSGVEGAGDAVRSPARCLIRSALRRSCESTAR